MSRFKKEWRAPIALAVVALVLAVVFSGPLLRWFGIELGGGKAGEHADHAHGSSLPEPVAAALRQSFTAYDGLRAALAADTLEGVADTSQQLAQALETARAAAPEPVIPTLEHGAAAAVKLRDAADLDSARKHFGKVSEALVALAAVDPSLQEGRHIFECPMAEGFNKWFQTSQEMANPYMGKKMLACGMRSDWGGHPETGLRAADADEIAHYVCPMHPSVKQHSPGACPICGMDLVPVTKGELSSGVILVDEARRQRIGVKTAKVERRPLTVGVQALGKVTWDETKLVDVTTRVMGWIQDLKVDATGQQVRKGQVLFTLYSPELLAAQQELLLAASRAGGTATPLLNASKQRLRLWGLSPGQIDRIIERGEPMENVPIVSPASGYVIEKAVVAGAAVEPGMKLYRIAPIDRVWLEADVYEHDLAHVRVGQKVRISLPFLHRDGESLEGKVSYIYPWLDEATRTGKVRVELKNDDGQLKPDMYANLSFERDLGERLQIPSSAVVYTGPRRLVFVDIGDDRMRPQVVKLGIQGANSWEVLEGLNEGDVVVTSGNFLIAAESRLRSGADWGGDK